ncbi:ATP-binding cassette sub-family A member 7-like [Paramacrobiotus metropolitanus]|uniref:ATP-binding cassette sub-family A member 7-like n=1 Tax=Paramacrobiotus metropolitanus TaxID=2943436 RepID=UPI0024463007|nr:ATP-binding cassette sub-family A member 7-like [Paramacrobiotus metropolitanus]XP_055329068.1 ATP-binding cassette sub-family A member 7-like [Paramacrobiotus metropolitanus]
MNFGKQLKLLIWKNYTLRKRQPVRFLIEIAWPIVLLALLALVRTRNLQTTIPECHFDEKALPSAGILPLLQSYVCTFNNTCKRNSTDDVYGTVNMYHDSIISRMFAILESMFSNQTLQDVTAETIQSTVQLIHTLEELANGAEISPQNGLRFRDVFPLTVDQMLDIVDPTGMNVSEELITGLLEAKFRPFVLGDLLQFLVGNQLFCDGGRLRKVLEFDKNVSVEALVAVLCPVPASTWLLHLGPVTNLTLITGKFRFKQFDLSFMFTALKARKLLSEVMTSGQKLTPFKIFIEEMQDSYLYANSSGMQFMGKFICGDNAEIFRLDGSKQNMVQKLRETQMSGNYVPLRSKEDDDMIEERSNNSSPFCNRVFDFFEKNSKIAIRFLWKPLKSFILGKLLYTPNTAASRSIIKRMNATFERIESLIWTGRQMSKMLPQVAVLLEAVANETSRMQSSSSEGFGQIFGMFSRMMGLTGVMPNLDQKWFEGMQINTTSMETLKSNLLMFAEFLGNVTSFMECVDLDKFVPMTDEKVLNSHGGMLVDNGTFWAGIVFENLAEPVHRAAEHVPSFIRYKIRYDVEKVDSTGRIKDRFWRPAPRRQPLTDMKYWTYGFIQLQDSIERAIMAEMLNSTESLPGLYLQQFPYPCYIEDSFFMAISRNFPLIMTLAWVYTAAMLVKSIVYEKEKRLRETMMMMGMSNAANWLSWFLETFVIMHLSIIFMVIILVYGKILMHSSWAVIYVFLLTFCLSTIAFGFFLSVLFSKANIAAAAGGILYFCTFMPYSLLIIWEDRIPFGLKVFSCFIPNVAFGWGSNFFARFEEQGIGVQWNNIARSPLENDPFCLIHCILMLIGDALLMFLLTWYLEAVMPGEYGIPRPWYFPVTKSYWFGIKPRKIRSDEEAAVDVKSDGGSNFEPEPLNLERGVEIHNLKKVYGNGKLAVDGLSLNVYEGITALLGHNGAGKTTTFSILCGLFPATSGNAKIYGYDVMTEMDSIRKSFGFCPQHNVLWDGLTVEEHLYFYASLKLSDPVAIKSEIDMMIGSVGLPHKRHEKAANLSGGMQRKLSVAIAYIGGAKVVLLDEPTAGVDPWARRGIWNLLIRFRKDRTTIMSTHFHGEADTLADRIAVIADGKLICGGSPVFLKSRFGNGYYLTLVKASGATNVEEVTRFVQEFIPEALLIEDVGAECAFVLPMSASRDGRFGMLFEALDARMGFLDVSSYGVRDTSLEEVFLRVMETHDSAKPGTEDDIATRITEEGFLAKTRRRLSTTVVNEPLDNSLPVTGFNSPVPPDIDEWDHGNLVTKRLQGSQLLWQQMKAMHSKRFHNMRRSKKSFFCEILLPALFVCLAMVVTLLTPFPLEMPPLELTPWLYGPPNYVFFSNDRPSDTNASALVNMLYEGPGMGTRCMDGDPVTGKACVPTAKADKSHLLPNYVVSRNATPACSCEKGGQQCPDDAGGPDPPCILLNTTDMLCNMTNRNITDWLLKTAKRFDSSRYGGYSFGQVDSFARFNFTHWASVVAQMLSNANVTQRGVNDGMGKLWKDFIMMLSQMFQQDNIKVWFNNRGWASSVSYVNAINNVLLRSRLKPDQNPAKYGMLAINHPLNRTEEQMEDQVMKESAKALLHAVCVIFAMSFVPASFVMFLIEERVSGAKNLQFTAKIKPWLYWVSTYMWDICNYLLTTVICVLIFIAFNEQNYVSPRNLPVLVCLLALYGFAAIPMMYIPSFFFRVPSSAFVALACLNLFLGIVSTISVFILELMDDQELQDIAKILRQVFLVLPHYCLGRGLMDMAIGQVKADVFARFGQEVDDHPFEWNFAGRNIACLCIEGVLFFAVTLLIEYRFFWRPRRLATPIMSAGQEDKDVAKERARIMSGAADGSVLKVADLTKVFRQRKRLHVAVDKINVGVGKGECFGLLGVNGAGKTTTFKMLTGNLYPTYGDAYVNGHSISTDLDGARRYIGYCPQFDAIHNLLTGREHLEFYARIHGIPEKYVFKAVERGISRLQLSAHARRCAGTYSGGNKRKLSTAIALIGDPDIVFLDEPTTGMDPKARRFLWNCILSMLREGRSVILTSHSLEECENLCTKLAIMVNGRFQCVGSLQHLKSRFGFGYSVIIRCNPTAMYRVCDFMETTFRGARMQERHYNTVQYRIPLRGLKLAQIFAAIENNRQELEIEDASVNQTNLEDIFIEFAKHQTDLAADEVLPDEIDPVRETVVDARAYDASSTNSSNLTGKFEWDRAPDFHDSMEMLVVDNETTANASLCACGSFLRFPARCCMLPHSLRS